MTTPGLTDVRQPDLLLRTARWFVLVSALSGLALEAWLGARELPMLLWMPVVTLVACGVLARVHEPAAFALPLAVAFVVPVIFNATLGRFFHAYHVVWFGAMLGAVIGARGSWIRWSVPSAWVFPLALWAMVVATAWPIVVARETDFTLAWLTRVYHMANSNLGGPPPVVAVWVINCALTLLGGLLWFDRLFAYAADWRTFRRWVLYSLAVGAIASALLGTYQGLIDVAFLNGHQWPELRRAGGGLIDADGFGASAGFLSSAFVALAASGGPVALTVGALGALASWGGLWSSGSRMALLGGLIGLAGIGLATLRASWAGRARYLIVAGAVVAAVGLTAFARMEWSTASPVARAMEDLPAPNRAALVAFVRDQLFDRGAPYGTATVRMFLESPLVGVGIGTFNGVFPDYALMLAGKRFSFDNAQSWYRQQFAEMGLLGVTGWLIWLATVAWLLWRTRGGPGRVFAGAVVKSALFAMAIVTAVSLPTQDSFVALLPWLLVFWYLKVSPDATAKLTSWQGLRPSVTGAIVWIWAVVFGLLSLSFGLHDYRPSMRAVRANWPYTAGFYDMEEEPADHSRFQWTDGHAVQTVPVRGPWLKITLSGGPPDMAELPVRLRIYRRYEPIVDVRRSSPEGMTWYVAAGDDRQMIIGIDTSRTWIPTGADRRELGVRVEDWTFVDSPPSGANVIR